MKNFPLFLLLVILSITPAVAQNPVLSLQTFSTGYSNPVDIENCGDNRLFIVERIGKIWICDANGNKSATPFLDLTSMVYSGGSEQGLLGLAFDPQFSSNRYLYVYYIDLQQNTQVSRFRVSANDSNKVKVNSEL